MRDERTDRGTAADDGAVTVSFVPTAEDQYRASREIRLGKRFARAAEVAFPVLIGINLLMVVSDGGWRAAFRGFALVFPLALVVWALRPWIARWQIARHRRKNARMAGPHTITISPAGVRVEALTMTLEHAWSGIVRARETREQFLIYYTADSAYFIPRRALRERDEAPLRSLLARSLGGRARLQPTNGTAR
jgi:hypothetical protein